MSASPPPARPPLLLALDTSTFTGTVAVTRGDRVLAEAAAQVTTHSDALLPMIRDALAAAGVTVADLDAIASGAGPGTFTGLRIGMATAKALCWAASKPLLTVSSLAALATNAPPHPLVVPCLDAKRREVFAGFYRWDGHGAPLAIEPEAALRPEALRERLAGRDALLIGDGVTAYADVLSGTPVAATGHAVRAAAIARLAALRLARGESDDLAATEPVYLRPSDAETGRRR